MKTVKMHFSRDLFYNDPNVPLYLAGHSYDIEEKLVEKWLKRGAQIVSEMPKEEAPKKPEAPKEEAPKSEDKVSPEVVVPEKKEEAKPSKPSKPENKSSKK